MAKVGIYFFFRPVFSLLQKKFFLLDKAAFFLHLSGHAVHPVPLLVQKTAEGSLAVRFPSGVRRWQCGRALFALEYDGNQCGDVGNVHFAVGIHVGRVGIVAVGTA